jgi:hypothetical protein
LILSMPALHAVRASVLEAPLHPRFSLDAKA